MEDFGIALEPARKRVKVEIEEPIDAAPTSLSTDLPESSTREASAIASASTNTQTSGMGFPHAPDISAVHASQDVQLAARRGAEREDIRAIQRFGGRLGVCHKRRGETSDALIRPTSS